MPSSFQRRPPTPANVMTDVIGSAEIYRDALETMHRGMSYLRDGMTAEIHDMCDLERTENGDYVLPIHVGSGVHDLIEQARYMKEWLLETVAVGRLYPELRDPLSKYLSKLMYPVLMATRTSLRDELTGITNGYERLFQYYTEWVAAALPSSVTATGRIRGGHPPHIVTGIDRLRALGEILGEAGSSLEEQHATVLRAINQVVDDIPPQADSAATDPMELYAFEVVRDLTADPRRPTGNHPVERPYPIPPEPPIQNEARSNLTPLSGDSRWRTSLGMGLLPERSAINNQT